MSYSFSIRAASKAEAKDQVAAKMAGVVESQAVHAKDRDQAVAAASAFIDVLDDDESKDVTVSMNGYLSGNWAGSDLTSFTGASVSVSVGLTVKAP